MTVVMPGGSGPVGTLLARAFLEPKAAQALCDEWRGRRHSAAA